MRARIFFIGALAALVWLGLFLFGGSIPFTAQSPGALDFIQYWSAFQLLVHGQNPYDGSLMHLVQAQVGQSPDVTVLMWNPPWTPLVMAPAAALPFGGAVAAWAAVSVVCLFVVTVIGPRALREPAPPLIISGLAVVLFYPLGDNFILGQLSIFLTVITALALYSIERGAHRRAGWLTALLTIKPHLFLLFIPPLIAWLQESGRSVRRRWLGGFVGGCVLLLALTFAISPRALMWWCESFSTPPTGPGAVATSSWKTATVSTWLRVLLLDSRGAAPLWPLFVVPLSAFAASAVFTLRRRGPIEWPALTPPLLCLSLGLSPYGWFYDQSLLALCQVAIVCKAWAERRDSRRCLIIAALLAIQIGAAIIAAQPGAAQHHYTWIPWAMLGVWLLARKTPSSAERRPPPTAPRSDPRSQRLFA